MRRVRVLTLAERVVAFALSGAVAALLPGIAPAQILFKARFEPLGTLENNPTSVASALSANGQVVVGNSSNRAFQWTLGGGIAPALPFPTQESRAAAVSADGATIAGFVTAGDVGEGTQAFRIGVTTGYEALNAPSVADAISSNGQMIFGTRGSPTPQAFYWTEAGIVAPLADQPNFMEHPLAASSTGSVVVGYRRATGTLSAPRPVRWRFGIFGSVQTELLQDLAGGQVGGEARGVSGNGDVVAGWSYGPSGQTAVAWVVSGAPVTLGSLPGSTSSMATAVSPDGTIIVGHGNIGANGEAFVWTLAGGLRTLRSELPEPAGWRLTRAVGVTSDATFVYFAGNGINPDGEIEAWWGRVRKPF